MKSESPAKLRARIRELEASIAVMNDDWQAETLRKLGAEQKAAKLEAENERLKGVVRRLLGHMSGIESAVAHALSSINAVTPGNLEAIAPEDFKPEAETAGRFTPIALSSTERYNAAIGVDRKDSVWHGITPNRRTRLRHVVVAEPSRGCALERVDLMDGQSDVPLLEGPIPVENLKNEVVDVDIVIAQKSPIVLLLTGKAGGVALVLEDAP